MFLKKNNNNKKKKHHFIVTLYVTKINVTFYLASIKYEKKEFRAYINMRI